MRSKTERKMLHMGEKPTVRKGKSSGSHGKFYSKNNDKFYAVTRLGGQDYYSELKTARHTREKSDE